MSKRNRFKKHRAQQAMTAERAGSVQKAPEKRKETAVNTVEYNMMKDFTWLFSIIIFYTGLVVGLYYYDNQTHILSTLADKVISVL